MSTDMLRHLINRRFIIIIIKSVLKELTDRAVTISSGRLLELYMNNFMEDLI